MAYRPYISVIVPFFNEEQTVVTLYERLTGVLEARKQSFELVFVDDGSDDSSAHALAAAISVDPRATMIRLRGNYGKSAALCAGFDACRGEIIFTMDADLQDDPDEIPRFLNKLNDDFDMIVGYKKDRKDARLKVAGSRLFNLLVRAIMRIPLHDVNCGYRCFRRQAMEEIRLYGEMHRFVPILAHWRRFKVAEIVVRHHARPHGKSKYGYSKIYAGLIDLLTVTFLSRYYEKPSHFFGLPGLLFGGVGLLICLYLSGLWFLGQGPIGNRPLLLLGILLILLGGQFLSLGLVSELFAHQTHRNSAPYAVAEIVKGTENRSGASVGSKKAG